MSQDNNQTSLWSDWRIKCVFIVIACNVDLLIPVLKYFHMSRSALLAITIPLATIELIYWYWFLGKVLKAMIASQAVKNEVAFAREMQLQLTAAGIIEYLKLHALEVWTTIQARIVRLHLKAIDESNWAVRLIRAYGHVAIIGISASPLPSERIICLIFCRSIHWYSGLCSLLVGNILHILIAYVGWSVVFHFFR